MILRMKLLFSLLFFFCSNAILAKDISMRRCLLLPIQDKLNESIGFKVFNKVEKYLKGSEWCYYQSNSEIINLLENYKNNLDIHLNNPDVLKLVAQKTYSGSLIRANLKFGDNGVSVSFKVYGSSGSDVFFSEKTHLNNVDIDVIGQTIINWLEQYKLVIPYDGKVIGVLGNSFSVDVGKQSGVLKDSNLKIIRPISKRNHPLLKEIVDWETVEIGRGKITHANISQSQGVIINYSSKRRLLEGDWVILDKQEGDLLNNKQPRSEDQYKFGKLGTLSLLLNLGTGSTSYLNSGGSSTKIGGFLAGIDLRGEAWVTRNYWFGLDVGKRSGSFKAKEGTISVDSNSASVTTFKLVGAYKYLPMGFFYGPQVDFIAGFNSYSYNLETQIADGHTGTKFQGLSFGIRGSVPLRRSLVAHLMMDFIIGSQFSEKVVINGDADSVSSYSFECGLKYKYAPNLTADFVFRSISNKAEFRSPTRELSHSESNVKLGTTLTF